MWRVVGLITDYGYVDTYVSEVKARLLNYKMDIQIVDITHGVASFNETEAAFLLKNASKQFPRETIFLCIVDPKVGTERRTIVIETRSNKLFIGPDTGIMTPAAEQEGIKTTWTPLEDKLPSRFSETFHGRDVFAEIAGRLLAGTSFEEILVQVGDYNRLALPEPRELKQGWIEATVMHVDKFGNLITNIHHSQYSVRDKMGEKISVRIRDKMLKIPLVKTYGAVKKGKPLLTIGGSGHLELSVNMGDASKRFKTKAGDKIRIKLI